MDLYFEDISEVSRKSRCGCYVSDPVFAQEYPNKFIMVPLKSSEYNVEIVNSIANVSLLQSYENPTNKYLELEYSFPISPNACVYKFVAVFGNKRMEGIVKEKEIAKLEYNQAIQQGKKAAYGQINAQSKDILTLKVGNVAPKESVKIQIEYLQELTLSCNMFYQLHMMGTISPRYMNSIPPEAIAKGLRNQAAKVEGKFYWSFKIILKTSRKVPFFDSNSHDIQLVSQNDSKTESVFAMTQASVPNKDFIFSYTTQDYEWPSYVFGRTDVGSTAMISFIPKFCTLSIDDAYKASVAKKGFETDIQNAKGQYVFLLDRSGSMSGARIEKAKQALILFIKSLPQDTYFNVISFGSGSAAMFTQSLKYNDKEVESAVLSIKMMSADMGGTEIYNPLFNLLSQKPIDGYPKQIFLLTDGGVSNTQGVINMVGNNNRYARVHTIGIGNGCSQDLILGCAKKGKGHHVFINDVEEPSSKIIQLLTDSLSPVISKMNLSYDKAVVQSIIPNPQKLPYILKNQLVNFYITFKGQLDKTAKFQFSYQDSLNKKPFSSQIFVDPHSQSSSFIDKMGNFKKIRLLQQSVNGNGNIEDMMFYVKSVNKEQVVKESVQHQILSQFTAFVCVQQQLIDGKYQEIKDTGKVKVEIISPPPIEKQIQRLAYQTNYLGSINQNFKACSIPIASYAPQKSAARQFRTITKSSYNAPPPAAMCKAAKKESASGGFFDSIKSFFVGEKKEQAQRYMAPPPARSRGIQPQQQICRSAEIYDKSPPPPMSSFQPISFSLAESEKKSMNNNNLFGSAKMSLQSKKIQKMQRSNDLSLGQGQGPISVKTSISDVISQQSTEGSWKNINLIGLLLGQDIQQKIASESNLIAVITYLIAKWIQKNHPETQYSLVIKKGLNFVKKNAANFDQFSQLYDHLVK